MLLEAGLSVQPHCCPRSSVLRKASEEPYLFRRKSNSATPRQACIGQKSFWILLIQIACLAVFLAMKAAMLDTITWGKPHLMKWTCFWINIHGIWWHKTDEHYLSLLHDPRKVKWSIYDSQDLGWEVLMFCGPVCFLSSKRIRHLESFHFYLLFGASECLVYETGHCLFCGPRSID